MAGTPVWISVSPGLGGLGVAPGNVWTTDGVSVTGTAVGVGGIPYPQPGMIAQFRDTGSSSLGIGEFIWLQGVANTTAGSVVSYTVSDGTLNGTTVMWAGTANTGWPLAVATAATVANTQGWYQIGGAAIVNVSGSISVASEAYYASSGTLGSGAVSGKQVMGAQFSGASGTWISANQAVVTIDRPHVQGQTS
jgi:hypothetical protein